ncbi:replication-relaxation family protein [Streptomyces sp. NPDC048209]|uniref:replication-relaxation family protein n=1 Tax=Streptomyces sp. NPDC048209 TaxID=3156689 RepID=UPI0034401C85
MGSVGGSKTRRYGSTGRTRTMCLEALGVVKVATAEHIRQLTCPGTKDAATVRGGLKDLEAEKLVVSPGSGTRLNAGGVRVTKKLWTLTPAGLEAAAVVHNRPAKEMGGTAKAAAASGAKHARKVTETLAAFLQTPPEPTRPVTRTANLIPAHHPQPAPAVRPPGLGPLPAWTTEAALPVAGTFTNPARGSVRADLVFAAPGHELVPLLFVEVDNGTEGPPILADKIDRHRKFFARTATTNGRESPLWRTVWPDTPREGHPPLALVFTKDVSAKAMQDRMRTVGQLARDHWQGRWHEDTYTPKGQKPDGYRDYKNTLPLLATTLPLLAAHGPHGPAWWRYGHNTWQTLTDALHNPDAYRSGYAARSEARRAAAEAEHERARAEQQEHFRRLEEGKWPCPTCRRFVYPDDGVTTGEECDPCQKDRRAHEAETAAAKEIQQNRSGVLGWRRRT